MVLDQRSHNQGLSQSQLQRLILKQQRQLMPQQQHKIQQQRTTELVVRKAWCHCWPMRVQKSRKYWKKVMPKVESSHNFKSQDEDVRQSERKQVCHWMHLVKNKSRSVSWWRKIHVSNYEKTIQKNAHKTYIVTEIFQTLETRQLLFEFRHNRKFLALDKIRHWSDSHEHSTGTTTPS